MYKSFHIKNFRGFRDLKLDNMARINLIAGKNNVGKTALLEALFIHMGTSNLHLTLTVNALRGIEVAKIEFGPLAQTPWDPLFHNFDVSSKIELEGLDTVTKKRRLILDLVHEAEELATVIQVVRQGKNGSDSNISLSSETSQVIGLEAIDNEGNKSKYHMVLDQGGNIHRQSSPPPPFPGIFLAGCLRIPLAEDADRFGNLVRLRRENIVVDALRVVDNRLTRLAVIPTGGTPVIHGDIGLGQLVTLPLMGDGMNRLASIILAIGNARNGVVLIDEVENGLHHSALKDVWKVIGDAAREFNTQVFATTHSWECIVAAHRTFSESNEYDFRYHRLDRDSETGNIEVVTYDQETLEATIEIGLEAR
jgi:hypothetical protein